MLASTAAPTEPVERQPHPAGHRSAPSSPTTTRRTALQPQPASPSQSTTPTTHPEKHIDPSHSLSLIGLAYSNTHITGKPMCESITVRSICDAGVSPPLYSRATT